MSFGIGSACSSLWSRLCGSQAVRVTAKKE